jgi:hypothetical protein
MKVEFDKSFEKSLNKIRNKSLYPRIERIILECEKANSIILIPFGLSLSLTEKIYTDHFQNNLLLL